MKKFIADYLTFTRKERIAVLLLLSVLLFVFFLPSFSKFFIPNKRIETDTSWISKMKQLEDYDSNPPIKNNYSQDESAGNYQFEPSVVESEKKLFYFDPNTISKEQWEQLGISAKTVTTIHNYLLKGGSFKTPEDLKKIYGLKQQDYERLLPYIKIATAKEQVLTYDKVATEKKETPNNNLPHNYTITDINKADTSAFIKLPGIGSKLAGRIVNFREKLGGFYSVEQIRETYGIQDSVYQKIKPYLQIGNTPVRKININTASADELKSHPYIKSNIAIPVIAYRNEHGVFSKVEDLRKVIVVTNEMYEKIAPYLTA
ncbi:MAG: helix-hairpin-helix domain-containing protein, partial [Chitinophagaceae bacterium]|nr:helix-hairpin-helix domain-containing protein [Chitinophagaceae bacterium]